VISRSPNVSIGTWYDQETDTTFLDISFTTTDRERAIELGRQFNQKAIYDLNALEEIPTGGTGEALAGLPSIEERLGILFQPGYISAPYAGEQAQATPAARGTPAKAAPETFGGGAEEVRQELGGIPEEEPQPLSDEAQEAVNSLPEEQRNTAQKAFARDDRDPLADDERRRGEPVTKRTKSKPVTPEKNTKLVADASKYGVFDKTP
jgi:hypothetical protein